MPERKNGRRNNGELCLSDGSGLYCRHAGPVYVLGRGRYRGEALKMDDCANCEFLEKCRARGKRWKAYIIRISKKFLGRLTK